MLTRLLAILTLVAGLPHPVSAQGSDAREAFARGYAHYTAGRSADAQESFRAALSDDFYLADYSLYYLGLIAFEEGNWDEVRQRVNELNLRFSQSVWTQAAALLAAKAALREKDYARAGEILTQLRAEKAVKRDISEEALYRQAQTREAQGEMRGAYTLYRELRDRAPTSRWTAEARKAQARLREMHAELFPFHTLESLAEEADRLARERQTGDAEILYKKLLNNAPDGTARLRFLSKLSALYLSVRNRGEAMPLLEQIAREYPQSAEAPRALYQIAQILWNRHDNAGAFDYFKAVIEKYPASAFVDRSKYATGDIHEYFGRKDEAAQAYISVVKQFPKSAVRDEAQWRLAWLYYRAGEMPAAAAAFRTLARQSKNGQFGSAAFYWQARSAERSGQTEEAKSAYRQIWKGGTESYYQALAGRALQRLGEEIEAPKPPRPAAAGDTGAVVDPEVEFHLARARELAALSLHSLAVAELDEIHARTKAAGPLRSLLMREYFQNHAYRSSLGLAIQTPLSRRERDFYLYPLAFWELIQQKAIERDLDPYLILALIRQESLFDQRARSPAAALGLMQLIPPTASRVARQLGLPPPSRDKLFEAEINLTLGTQYLKDLLLRYSNNWQKALAAYNAGEAAVDRWEREIVTDDIEEFVERIPYVETRGYVKLVLRNHRIYKQLYDRTQ